MKFKVGDRVVIYGLRFIEHSDFYALRNKGTVVKVIDKDEMHVKYDDNEHSITTVHPNQCRKLKAKNLKRKVFVNLYADGYGCAYESLQKAIDASVRDCMRPILERAIEFVEVRKKKNG